MSIQFNTAVTILRDSARSRDSGERIQERLSDVQKFLSDDLVAVEEALGQLANTGVEPAPAAAKHLIEKGGKRVRPISLLLAARCFEHQATPELYKMAAVVELAHSATLLHDDVVDEGMERRGSPTSRRIYGNGVSVLAGDMLLIEALSETQTIAPALVPALVSTLRRLVNGEIVQLRGRTELDVSQSTYEQILKDKTASLFSFACKAGGQIAGADRNEQAHLARFGESLGMAFQLVDDVLDYQGEDTGKELFADLLEGKLTLPLVLAIEDDAQLGELVTQIHGGDNSVVDEVSRRVKASGSCVQVRAQALDYTEKAVKELSSLPFSPARSLLEVVAREMTMRVS